MLHSAKKQHGVGSPNNPYTKTELCKNWPNCSFGDSCAFAHGENDLRCKTLNEMQRQGKIPCAQKYRCYPCINFISTGACPYKHRCVFLHDPRLAGNTRALIYARPGEAIFRTTSSKNDVLQWPINKQVFNEDLFIDISETEIVEYTAPDQFALSDQRLQQSIFYIWSGFISKFERQQASKSQLRNVSNFSPSAQDYVSSVNEDPSTAFFLRKTKNCQVVKVRRLKTFYDLSTKSCDQENEITAQNNVGEEQIEVKTEVAQSTIQFDHEQQENSLHEQIKGQYKFVVEEEEKPILVIPKQRKLQLSLENIELSDKSSIQSSVLAPCSPSKHLRQLYCSSPTSLSSARRLSSPRKMGSIGVSRHEF